MMERLTFDGNFCDIAQCTEIPGGSFCEDGACSQKKVWERLKAYEDTGLTPERCAELAKADKDGRLVVLPKSENETCGSCQHFNAVEVCYCKDCKHWDRMNTSDEGGCYRDPLAEGVDWTRADDYCSRGERKEG